MQTREQKRDLMQSNVKHTKTTGNTWVKKRNKTFDNTTITDRLWMVSWSDSSHPTGVVNLRFKGPTSILPSTTVQSKGRTLENL